MEENATNQISVLTDDELSRLFVGDHEVLECQENEDESDLTTHKKNCKKYPSHDQYIPVRAFNSRHLPSGYHDNAIVELVHALSDITVRVSVKFTSQGRPELVPETEMSYPCYHLRERSNLRLGTGRVWGVDRYTEDKNKPCPCEECKCADSPRKSWGKIIIITARHVVFDQTEARQAKCRLWFDEDHSPVVEVDGWSVCGIRSDFKGDWSLLYCVTHDLELTDKMKTLLACFDKSCDKIEEKYSRVSGADKVVLIVSHPHGCPKQVSVGRWVNKQELDDFSDTRYTYTACTCPGSSGAPVYRLGGGWCSVHPHSGVNSEGHNFSGLWVD